MTEPSDPIIRVENLTAGYEGTVIVDRVKFEIYRGEVFGNLYLCEKRSVDEFTPRDEERVVALAAAAGSAIANSRLYAEGLRREQSLAALQGVSTALLSGADPDHVLQLVAAHARDILAAEPTRP